MEKIAPTQGRGRTPVRCPAGRVCGPPLEPTGAMGQEGSRREGCPSPAEAEPGAPAELGPGRVQIWGGGGWAPSGRRVGRLAFPPLQTQGSRPTRGGGGQSKPDVGAAQKMLIILTRKSPGQRNNEMTGAMGAGGDRRHEGATCVPCRQPAALGSLHLPRGVQLHMWGKAPPGRGGWGTAKETQALGHHAVSPRVPSTPTQAGQAGGGAGGSGANCPGWGHPEGAPAWFQEGVGTFVRTGLSVGHEAEAGQDRSSRGADRPSGGRGHVWSAPREKPGRQAGGTGMPSQGWLESPPQASPRTPTLAPAALPGPQGGGLG